MTSNRNILLNLKLAKNSAESSALLCQFYNETSHLVFAFCRKKGLSTEDAEEIVQIVYTQIFNKRADYNPDHSPLAWLYVITRSKAKDFLKIQKTYKNYVADFSEFVSQTSLQSPSNPYEGENSSEDVTSILTNYKDILTANEVAALKMRYNEDKEFIEIADHLNTSVLNIRKIISRGLKKMRKGGS